MLFFLVVSRAGIFENWSGFFVLWVSDAAVFLAVSVGICVGVALNGLAENTQPRTVSFSM